MCCAWVLLGRNFLFVANKSSKRILVVFDSRARRFLIRSEIVEPTTVEDFLHLNKETVEKPTQELSIEQLKDWEPEEDALAIILLHPCRALST